MRKGAFDNSADVYCNKTTAGGGWIVIQRNRKGSTEDFNIILEILRPIMNSGTVWM